MVTSAVKRPGKGTKILREPNQEKSLIAQTGKTWGRERGKVYQTLTKIC